MAFERAFSLPSRQDAAGDKEALELKQDLVGDNVAALTENVRDLIHHVML